MFSLASLGSKWLLGCKQEGRTLQWLPHFSGYFSTGLSLAAQGAAMSLLIKTFCFTCTQNSRSIHNMYRPGLRNGNGDTGNGKPTQSWFVP